MFIAKKTRKLLNIKRGFRHLNQTFGLNEDQKMLQQAALDFSAQVLAKNTADWDRESHFPIEEMRQAAEMGFASIYTSYEGGGCGLGRFEASLIFEALSYGCVSTSAFLSIHNMVNWMIDVFGNEEQKVEWCQRLSTFEIIASYCLTEPNAGSDAADLKTTAKKDGDDYVLNGSKIFISGGGVSDIYLVMCKTGENEISAVIVPKGTPGLSFGKREHKMGWKSQPTTMVMFEDCRIPKKNLIGIKGEGFKYALQGLNGGRINIASCSLGGAAFALDEALEYSKARSQFKRPLAAFQNIQFKLADMATDLTTSRLMVREAAKILDNKDATPQDKMLYTSMAKKHATDVCFDIANYALQIHGGYGYLNEYPIERVVRDLRVHQILEGTNEIMRLIIARNILN